MDHRENIVTYLEALEVEKNKVQMFPRELPLCLELVNQAIEGCRKQLYGRRMDHVKERSDCSEVETIMAAGTRQLVLEEFIPLKSCGGDDDEEVGEEGEEEYSHEQPKDNNKDKMKSDWLRTAQLWNPSSDSEKSPCSELVMEVKGNKNDGGTTIKLLNKEESSGKSNEEALLGNKLDGATSSPSPTSSMVETTVTTKRISSSSGGITSSSGRKEDKQLGRQGQSPNQSRRKQRRCWSHDLHRSFLEALQQLGGPEAATPKQIREIMKVDGLTNDEVKSHLQKYRLHAKRPSSANHDNSIAPPPPPPQPQPFVVVRPLWVPPPPPPEFPSVSAPPTPTPTPSAAMGTYPSTAPQAKIPQASFIQKMQRQSHYTSEDRCSHGKQRVLSNSTASSSSVYASAVC